ncbi:MAG: zinc ribbon domain-containing protein [Elusimicrobiota bacterium]|nr:zinc ribbon domain-containing protein [Elusimicrobiota bacterium]
MPLFEFSCKKCNKNFEILILGDEKAQCPKCKSLEVEKQFSLFSSVKTVDCANSDVCKHRNSHSCNNSCCH